MKERSSCEPAIKYARTKALEIVLGRINPVKDFRSKDMERGNDQESEACERYELEHFYRVNNGGFNIVDRYGDSPDGNVLEDGCIEIKCVIANTQWVRLEKGGYDESYKWQIQGHLWLGEKKWCDFVSYCPQMPQNKQLYVFRVYRDEDMIERLKKRLKEFDGLIDEKIKILKSN